MPQTKVPEIDDKFFQKYAGSRKTYQEVYASYSAVEDCIELFQLYSAPKLKKICVLGAATGEVLTRFYEIFSIRPYGCEINQWAHSQIQPEFKKRILCMDMREYVVEMQAKGECFDLVFANSFQYLEQNEIPNFLQNLAPITRYVHFYGSFKNDCCPDPYRKTLKSYEWWNKKFSAAGLGEMINMWDSKTYLWQNLMLKDN